MDYNPIAPEYEIHHRDATTLWLLGYNIILNYFEPLKGKNILDYGCGSGNFCRLINEKGAIATGLDVSEKMIEIAKKNDTGPNSYFNISSGELNFLEESSFDHAVSNFVLCTLPSKLEIKKILKQIKRILKKDGTFILMNSNWDKSNGKEFISFKLEYCENLFPGQRINAVTKSDPPIVFEDYFWPTKDYCQMLMESGFELKLVREPVATGNHYPWVDEEKFPPYFIIVAKKK